MLLLIAAVVAGDQLVKYWAIHSLAPVRSIDFIRFGDLEVLDLTYLENTGAIFGSMSGQRWFLIGFTSLVIAAGVVALFFAGKRSKFLATAVVLFVAGGIGNLIDRVRFGYVVDMFEVKLFHFAIFNVADIAVTVAFVMMIVYLVFIDPKIEKARKAAKEKETQNA